MDSRDQLRGAVERVVEIARRVTRAVQLLPFAYLALYSVHMVAGTFAPDEMVLVSDGVMTMSPFVTASFLVLSRMLRLCRWHKAACLIPTASQVETFVDSYLFTFTQTEVTVINITIGVLSAAFVVLANRHFFHGRKGNTIRDSRILQEKG